MNNLIKVSAEEYQIYAKKWFYEQKRLPNLDEHDMCIERKLENEFEQYLIDFDMILGLQYVERVPDEKLHFSHSFKDVFQIKNKKKFFAFILKNEEFEYELTNANPTTETGRTISNS